MYTKDDIEYVRKIGTRLEVYDGVAYCTAGKLTKDCLEKRGNKIISKRRSALGKQRFQKKNPFKSEPVSSSSAETVDKPDPVSGPPKTIRRRKRKVRV